VDAQGPEGRPDARQRRTEWLATLLLSVAAVATAWSTYQGARWRGEQAAETSRATAARIESSEAATHAGQLTQIDIATFTQWVDAQAAGDADLADFYQRRFREEFEPAFDAWSATQPFTNADAPPTPFTLPEYQLADAKRATRLDRQAAERTGFAGEANRTADRYMLAVVLFASSLFFAGISAKVRSQAQREVLLGLGGAMFLGAAVWVLTSPVSFPG
jgi:hypothetical protein